MKITPGDNTHYELLPRKGFTDVSAALQECMRLRGGRKKEKGKATLVGVVVGALAP